MARSKKKANKTVLIIDDDEALQMSFKGILQSNGYDVDAAGTGRDAIEKTSERSYDIALIDIRLPDMNGDDLLIRMQDSLPNAVKIMITGIPSIDSLTKTQKQGADAYMVKPVKIDYLLSLIEEKYSIKNPEKNLSS
ncbi:MAG: response regulator [Thaumarchaeota archaeon]|nr:response regulator [Nitrososphaerota archaeon]MCL5318116.1 response regulator [Nitrososphaerota archaeon]